jgi:hypothetical protein
MEIINVEFVIKGVQYPTSFLLQQAELYLPIGDAAKFKSPTLEVLLMLLNQAKTPVDIIL